MPDFNSEMYHVALKILNTRSEQLSNDELMHYGTPRHSGRYPYGSGERPHQHNKTNLGSQLNNVMNDLNESVKRHLELDKFKDEISTDFSNLKNQITDTINASKSKEQTRQVIDNINRSYNNLEKYRTIQDKVYEENADPQKLLSSKTIKRLMEISNKIETEEKAIIDNSKKALELIPDDDRKRLLEQKKQSDDYRETYWKLEDKVNKQFDETGTTDGLDISNMEKYKDLWFKADNDYKINKKQIIASALNVKIDDPVVDKIQLETLL